MDSHTIRWVEEEVVDDLSLTYGWFYAALRKNPGEWAVHPGHYNTALEYIKTHPEFEAKTKTVDGIRVGVIRMREPDDDASEPE